MPGFQDDPVVSKAEGAAIEGHSRTWMGVFGKSESTTGGHGVLGEAVGTGVAGTSQTWVGVYGETNGTQNGPAAVWADGKDGAFGVKGHAKAVGAAGVAGFHLAEAGDGGPGVWGESVRSYGVRGVGGVGVSGTGRTWIGVFGESDAPRESGSAGVWGDGKTTSDGVKGVTNAQGKAAVSAFQLANNGPGVYAEGAPAGFFKGNVVVTGDLVLEGADYAECLDVAETVDQTVAPGMVVVLDDEGKIRPCTEEYDSRVAGVVSGAGGVKPALVLDRHDGGAPVALIGKLWVLADADAHPIRCGDLLTTSNTPGHAQHASDRYRAMGAVIGKALTGLACGKGMIRVLVSAT